MYIGKNVSTPGIISEAINMDSSVLRSGRSFNLAKANAAIEAMSRTIAVPAIPTISEFVIHCRIGTFINSPLNPLI
ncbi:hypothetical protein D3C77_603710 [compost metagenome]